MKDSIKNRKRLVIEILVYVIIIVLPSVLLAIGLNMVYGGEDENTTLERLAYDQSVRKYAVYIKENGEYVPYLVLESDYDGNVLLLRENVLPEAMQYRPAEHEDGRSGGFAAEWTWYEYGSYYEESSIDEFLNTDFPEVFSPDVQTAIVDTTIEVTDMDSYTEEHRADATHMIERKVFLLSAVELGITSGVDHNITREGKALKYFENTKHPVKKAYAADGKVWNYWTRTPYIWKTYTVTIIGTEYEVNYAVTDLKYGVRPAFCMAKDTAVHKESGIIEKKSVYVLDLENE